MDLFEEELDFTWEAKRTLLKSNPDLLGIQTHQQRAPYTG